MCTITRPLLPFTVHCAPRGAPRASAMASGSAESQQRVRSPVCVGAYRDLASRPGMVHAWVSHSVLDCNVFKTKVEKRPFFGMRVHASCSVLADATSKPSQCHGRMRGVLGHAAIGLSTACDAIDEQETCTRRLRRRSANGCHRAVKIKTCARVLSSLGLPSPHNTQTTKGDLS